MFSRNREAYVSSQTLSEKTSQWLRELGPLRREPSVLLDCSRPMLVMIDLQRLFLDPASPAFLPAWPAVSARCGELLQRFRQRQYPVIWTRHLVPENDTESDIQLLGGRPLRPSDPLSAFAAGWMPNRGELVVEKSRYSAWSVPEFASRARSVSCIVLAGVTTERCILATAIEAAANGVMSMTVADGCASVSESLHCNSLRAIVAGDFGQVASVDEVLRRLPLVQEAAP